MQDLISVVIPIYNVEEYLEKCVESICGQTYQDLEIILVDDGSEEKCRNLCDELAQSDARIKVIHKKNGGLSDARNAGIDVANGEFIIFIDSDDYIDSTMLEKLWKRIRADQSDISLCGVKIVYEGGKRIKREEQNLENSIISADDFWRQLYGINYLPMVISVNKLYRRELFEQERFQLGKLNEDEFMLHRIISKCQRISVVAEDLYYYVRRAGSIMTSNYSVKRLDGVEALNIRTEYFIEKQQYYFAAKTLSYNIGNLMQGYCNLDMKIDTNKARYREVEQKFKHLFRKVLKKEHNVKFCIKGLIFCMSPRLCNALFSNR